uniref:SGNH hydrolase-type esterase domain-containing protein n=1 Tax=Amphiprion percula TaxID=161767 RepID=A0A3P8RMB8_AMPPE
MVLPGLVVDAITATVNIRFFNATTRCFPGATAAGLLDKLLELLQSIPSSVCRVIIHVGTNDTTRRQSELMKQDFMDLFRLVESCGKSVFISGPIPTLSHGAERFSRLLSLSTWLQHTCTAHNLNFTDNFNLFWNRPGFYLHDGLHPSTLGSSVLTANIHHAVQSTPAD